MLRELLRHMDAAAFLGLDVWDFSARSLRHPYGRLFVKSVVLRHPWRTLKGLCSYGGRVRRGRRPDLAPVGLYEQPENRAAGALVVGMGYCEKPLQPPCPAGRFNHSCVLMERMNESEAPAACRRCRIGAVAHEALGAGATVYIMTSAEDIARDLLLPSVRLRGGRQAALSVCAYSIPPLTLAMTICRIRGSVFPYAQGDCRDFLMWSRADVGLKDEQTSMSESASGRILALLEERSRRRADEGLAANRRFERVGNMYVPGGRREGDNHQDPFRSKQEHSR